MVEMLTRAFEDENGVIGFGRLNGTIKTAIER